MKVEFRQENRQNELESVWTITDFRSTGYFSKKNSISKSNEAQLQGKFKTRLYEDGWFEFDMTIINASSESNLIVESEVIIIDRNNVTRYSKKITKREILPLKEIYLEIDHTLRNSTMRKLMNSDVIYVMCLINYEVKPQLTNYLKTLMGNGSLSDVALLLADGSRFPAHKCILARSPVFAAMFSHDMRENRESTIVIDDVQANVLRALLQYIYTGICDADRSVDVGELLAAADKYALEDLKTYCEKKLAETINIDNAVYCLLLGEHHNVQLLMERARFFIFSNFYEVLKTNSMRSLAADRPSLFYELVKDTYEWGCVPK